MGAPEGHLGRDRRQAGDLQRARLPRTRAGPPECSPRTRVIVLGDSIAFGLGVSDEETFTHLLDVRDNGIEAGNLAVQGYGPGQELLVLLGEGLRSDPDVVVLAFCLANDFAEAVLPVSLYDGRTPKPRFRLVGDRLVLDNSTLKHTGPARAPAVAQRQLTSVQSCGGPDPVRVAPPAATWRDRKREALRDEEYALRLNVAIVRRMDAVCRERGIAFILAAFPEPVLLSIEAVVGQALPGVGAGRGHRGRGHGGPFRGPRPAFRGGLSRRSRSSQPSRTRHRQPRCSSARLPPCSRAGRDAPDPAAGWARGRHRQDCPPLSTKRRWSSVTASP